MADYDFDTIKAGDMLLMKYRQFCCRGFGAASPFRMDEWVELTVDSVTPKFYSVGGEKYRKDAKGQNFMRRHYIPGKDGAPNGGNTVEFERRMALYSRLNGIPQNILSKLEKLPLEDAASFASRIKMLEAEIETAAAEVGRD